MVDEGVLMAEAAARMSLRNVFIVEALRGEGFDDISARDAARQALFDLERESKATARRTIDTRERAEHREGRATHQHDYRRSDSSNLTRRVRVYDEIARRLQGTADDEVALAALIARAREEAWSDVAGAIESKLDRDWQQWDAEPEYPAARGGRILELEDDLRRALEGRAVPDAAEQESPA
ncbi:MAG TPA: hypothetical protein VFU07_10285 [Candidatus Lumbricidophila sp.]|nr:hypothetical protein [Candidatus Lumbricidophila sp.]